MPLYAIRNDGYKFKELSLNTADVARHAPDDVPLTDVVGYYHLNIAMRSWWHTPETSFKDIHGVPKGAIPDISLWTGGAGSSLVLSPKAFRMLEDLLASSGEFLPVTVKHEKYEDQTFHIFNCLVLADADEAQTEHEYIDGVQFGLKHIGFTDSVANLLVFKSPINNCMSLFCGERFKEAVESFGLTGVIFDENLIEVFE
jgi:hypothetical protein